MAQLNDLNEAQQTKKWYKKWQYWTAIIIALLIIQKCADRAEIKRLKLVGTYTASAIGDNGDIGKRTMFIDTDNTFSCHKWFQNSTTGQISEDYFSGKISKKRYKIENGKYHLFVDGWDFGSDQAVMIIDMNAFNDEGFIKWFELDPTMDRVYGRVWNFERD